MLKVLFYWDDKADWTNYKMGFKRLKNSNSFPCYCAAEAAVKLSVVQYAEYVLVTTAGVNQLD